VTRGPHPDDARLFGPGALPRLRAATAEFAWLLSRGYAQVSSLKLVGDRHDLDRRQRLALMRSTCSDTVRANRSSKQLTDTRLAGAELWIDGFNVLTTVETGLAGGVVLRGRDGALRDIAGVHGSWRRGAVTDQAIDLLLQTLRSAGAGPCTWWLDQPVSNSGRLRERLLALGTAHAFPWRVEIVASPDAVLRRALCAIATSDGPLLDAARAWFDLAGTALARHPGRVWCIEMGDPPAQELSTERVL
jgi:hypothetical protein